MKNKKWVQASILLILPLAVFFMWQRQRAGEKEPPVQPQKLKVQDLPSPLAPVRSLSMIPPLKINPSSPIKQPSNSSKREKIYYKGREVIGPEAGKREKDLKNMKIINTINPHWKDRLMSQLHRFQPSGTKIKLSEQSSFIQSFDTKGRYIEVVMITTTLPNGKTYSFNANVDSSSGKILATWNRTLYDPPNPRAREGFTPSGVIKKMTP